MLAVWGRKTNLPMRGGRIHLKLWDRLTLEGREGDLELMVLFYPGPTDVF